MPAKKPLRDVRESTDVYDRLGAGDSETPPASSRVNGQTSPPADSPPSTQADKPARPKPPPTKSYRLYPAHSKRFALWAKERDMTESEATRQAQLLFMEWYDQLQVEGQGS